MKNKDWQKIKISMKYWIISLLQNKGIYNKGTKELS